MAECGINKNSGGMEKDDFTALREHVLKGKIAGTSDSDVPAEGTMEVQSVINFSVAQYSSLTLLASWALPEKGPWSGLKIMCKQEGYPVSPNDGTLFYEGSFTSATKLLTVGTWYFRAWNYMTTNYGRKYGSYQDTIINNEQVKGRQIFTSSDIFTVPEKVYTIDIFMVGGGGAGNNSYTDWYGGGAGGGYATTIKGYQVTPGSKLNVVIGSGGRAGDNSAIPGGATSVAGFSADGGVGGINYTNGGRGGSGGGSRSGAGGFNGSSGNGTAGTPGSGQGVTTRAFGEPSGTLYAGGGAGGYGSTSNTALAASGGAGGGGNGGVKSGITTRAYSSAGVSGTGGGGGGGAKGSIQASATNPQYFCFASNGGSGIAIIRWGY